MGRFGGELVQTGGGRFGGELIAPEEEKGFAESVGEDIAKRNIAIQETLEAKRRGDIGAVQGAAQAFGQVAGGALDVGGEAMLAGGRFIEDITPEAIKEPVVETAKEAWEMLSTSEIGKAAGEAIRGGVEKWNEFKQEKPQEAKTVEGLTNIALVFAPVKTKANAEPSVFGKTAQKIEKGAWRQESKQRAKFVGDLISPKKTPTVKVAETARTTEKGFGLTKRSVVELSPREAEIAKEVGKITRVTPKNSIQGNLNVIVSENQKLAKALDKDVGTRRILTIKKDVTTNIDNAITKLIEENPTIVGAEGVATKIANKAKQIIAEMPPTPKGLLDARKELDSWIRSQKGSKIFDPSLESALSVSVREVRNTINDVLEANVRNVAVKKELKKQSLLYDAVETLGVKAAEESNFAIGRLLQNISKVLPWRRSFQTDIGALMGLGIIGSSEVLAPIFAGGLAATAVGVGAYKTVISPATKRALAKTIKAADKAILSSKNPSMIKQLRADRALLIELLKTAETQEPQPE